MTPYLALFCVVLLALVGIGVYDLQVWLERWDLNRHIND
jgi:hypothetical protein